MSASIALGSLARSSPCVLAERCARAIGGFSKGTRRAVTCDPRGRVAVEPVHALGCEADLVGVYASAREGAWVELAALIERDLKAMARELRLKVAA